MRSYRMKIVPIVFAVMLVLGSTAMVFGLPDQAATQAGEKAQVPVQITVIGDDLVKVVITHYTKPVKPPGADSTARGFKLTGWHIPAPMVYYLNPANSGVNTADCEQAMETALATWNSQLQGTVLFNNNIGSSNSNYTDAYNEENLITFDDLDTGIIAMATTWYNPQTNVVLASDISFNTDYTWGIGTDFQMDIENITTHEVGHVCGLSDLYVKKYSAMTMCGWVFGYGEIDKRTLEAGDIAGLLAIYGQ